MNKLKEELRLKMLGQLSDDKTELDINNAYEVCVKFAVLFSKFLRKIALNFLIAKLITLETMNTIMMLMLSNIFFIYGKIDYYDETI